MPNPGDPQLDRVRDVFDEWAQQGRAESMATSHTPFAQRAFRRLALTEQAWYLDIGCGNGYTVRWAASAAPRGRAVGIDLSPQMIERARTLSRDYGNVEFHVTSFPHHSLPAGRFDAVFSMEVFYYLPDMRAALEETRRLLKPGGRFTCAVDYYGENVASHGWPSDIGVPMHLLDAAGWGCAFADAGFVSIAQERIRLDPEETSDAWKIDEGSLLTIGRRPPGEITGEKR